ncbi:MAG: hypothetical protein JNK48_28800 [Bryobacterales bacterium]|nr:hypothetical protein [Bryobacterales bacterium]
MYHFSRVALFAALSAAAFGGDFFPLANGNSWTYRESSSGHTITVRVGTPLATQSGRVYHTLTGYGVRPLLVRNDENQRLMYYDADSSREFLLTSFVADGQTWVAPERECPQQGHTQARRVPHNGPSGSWERNLEIRYSTSICNDSGLDHELYAENVGMVRRVVQSFLGLRAYELVYARVGSAVIEGGDRGRFTIAAISNHVQRVWQVTLRVDMGLSPSIRVRFPSSQDYDLVLRDSNGKIVYTWSADKAFLFMERSVNIGTGFTATVNVPYPANADPAMVYSLEAFLTTAPGEPKFAATAAVTVPQVTIGNTVDLQE